MAKKKRSSGKSRSKKKKGRLWAVLGLIFTVLSGSGVGGYLNPDLPVAGALVHGLRSRITANGTETRLQEIGQALHLQGQTPISPIGGAVPAQLASSQRPADKILIASFNIQVFGKSKLGKSDAMSVIVQCIRQFDLVAIQEVRAKEDDILPRLIAMLNADGSKYSFLIGPRLGRSVSTEQYAFVFDTNRIEHDPSSVGTMGDPNDLLHREPFAARFRARTSAPDKAFTFWLVNIHTDPDEVKEEVDALAEAMQAMRSTPSGEDDVILLGDLNASETQMGKLAEIPGIKWVVGGGVMTNTRQNKAYDNILFDGPSTSEYTGRWGVLNFEEAFQLSRDDALKVSDHFPVWAEFQVWEASSQGIFANLRGGRH